LFDIQSVSHSVMDTIAINNAFKEMKLLFPPIQLKMAFDTLSEILYRPFRSVLLVSKLTKKSTNDIILVLDNTCLVQDVHFFTTFDEEGIQITSKGLFSVVALVLQDDVFVEAFSSLISKINDNVYQIQTNIEDTIVAPVYKDPLAMVFVQLIDADYKTAVKMSAAYVENFLKSINCSDRMHEHTCKVLASVLKSQAGESAGFLTVASRKRKVAEVMMKSCKT